MILVDTQFKFKFDNTAKSSSEKWMLKSNPLFNNNNNDDNNNNFYVDRKMHNPLFDKQC